MANQVLKHPLATEKSSRMITFENKLVFIVERKVKKEEVKKAIEDEFNVKIQEVKSLILPSGKKKVYVKLSPDSSALDIATKLGLL